MKVLLSLILVMACAPPAVDTLVASRSRTLVPISSEAALAARLRELEYVEPPKPEPCRALSSIRSVVHARADQAGRPTEILGTVRDMSGGPLSYSNAYILSGASQGTRPLSVATDSGGRYRLELSRAVLDSAAKLVLRVRAIGYVAQVEAVAITPGDSVTLDFALCKDIHELSQVFTGEGVEDLNGGQAWITNRQHDDVEESDIVKVHGDHLVVLRRGRLFTINIGGDALAPIAAVSAFPPSRSRPGGWYEDLLIEGDRAVVIGRSDGWMGPEINLFRLDAAGGITYESTYQMRGGSQYGSRDFVSQLVHGKLILQTSSHLDGMTDPLHRLPWMRRWRSDSDSGSYERILPASRVFEAPRALRKGDVHMHTITICDVHSTPLKCEATGILGTSQQVTYVSPNAAYMWMVDARSDAPTGPPSTLYRLPFDGGAPTAIGVEGRPTGRLPFLEDPDGFLNVVVQRTDRSHALMRVPLSELADGSTTVDAHRYRALRVPAGEFRSRFVGDYLLYATGLGWWNYHNPTRTELVALPRRGGDERRIAMDHGIDRIEASGDGAIVAGTNERAMHFTRITLGAAPRVARTYRIADVRRGDVRPWAFHYRADSPSSGDLGLPLIGGRLVGTQMREVASVSFIRDTGAGFIDAGSLEGVRLGDTQDGCRAGCFEWYDTSRPIFVAGRVFALLGYEVVEGVFQDGKLRERRRIDFDPRTFGAP